jgi:hypothetical protein
MTKSQKLRKLLGDPYRTGPAACMRTVHVTGPCCTAPAGASVASGATTPLPEARGATQASAGARGGAFNRKPWGREYSRYLEG